MYACLPIILQVFSNKEMLECILLNNFHIPERVGYKKIAYEIEALQTNKRFEFEDIKYLCMLTNTCKNLYNDNDNTYTYLYAFLFMSQESLKSKMVKNCCNMLDYESKMIDYRKHSKEDDVSNYGKIRNLLSVLDDDASNDVVNVNEFDRQVDVIQEPDFDESDIDESDFDESEFDESDDDDQHIQNYFKIYESGILCHEVMDCHDIIKTLTNQINLFGTVSNCAANVIQCVICVINFQVSKSKDTKIAKEFIENRDFDAECWSLRMMWKSIIDLKLQNSILEVIEFRSTYDDPKDSNMSDAFFFVNMCSCIVDFSKYLVLLENKMISQNRDYSAIAHFFGPNVHRYECCNILMKPLNKFDLRLMFPIVSLSVMTQIQDTYKDNSYIQTKASEYEQYVKSLGIWDYGWMAVHPYKWAHVPTAFSLKRRFL